MGEKTMNRNAALTITIESALGKGAPNVQAQPVIAPESTVNSLTKLSPPRRPDAKPQRRSASKRKRS
jgi:hypothetical protein